MRYTIHCESNLSRKLPGLPQKFPTFATYDDAWSYCVLAAERYARDRQALALNHYRDDHMSDPELLSVEADDIAAWRSGDTPASGDDPAYTFAYNDFNDADGEVRWCVVEVPA